MTLQTENVFRGHAVIATFMLTLLDGQNDLILLLEKKFTSSIVTLLLAASGIAFYCNVTFKRSVFQEFKKKKGVLPFRQSFEWLQIST